MITAKELDGIEKWAIRKDHERGACVACSLPSDVSLLIREIRCLRDKLMEYGETAEELDNAWCD